MQPPTPGNTIILLNRRSTRVQQNQEGSSPLSQLVIHVPHSSTFIPTDERSALLPDDATLSQELLRMTDAWTDRLADGVRLEAARIVFPVSRLVVDVERFPDDALEPMAAKGMGAVYTRLSTGEPLRREDAAERARIMARWHYPHHARLCAAVEAALSAQGHCLILDIHSFPSRPLPHEPDQTSNRPEICIGLEPLHSPFENEEQILKICQRFNFQSEINRPFSGSIVPAEYYGINSSVTSLMIEVRRDLYMSEITGAALSEFDRVTARICRLIEALVSGSRRRSLSFP